MLIVEACVHSRVLCLIQATAEANNLSAVADAKDVYITMMEDVCGGAKPYMNTATIEAEHRRVKDKALNQFASKRKMGGDEFSEKYRDQLEHVRVKNFLNFKKNLIFLDFF